MQKHFWIAIINKNIIRDRFGKQSGEERGGWDWIHPGSFIMVECVGQVCPHKGCSALCNERILCVCVVAAFRFRFVEGSSGMGDGPQVALNSGTPLPPLSLIPGVVFTQTQINNICSLFCEPVFVMFATNFQIPLRFPASEICWNFKSESSPMVKYWKGNYYFKYQKLILFLWLGPQWTITI